MQENAQAQAGQPLRAVLWDMDGTLVDTEPYWIAAETEIVTKHGGHWTPELGLQLVGSDLRAAAAVLQRAGADMPIDDIVTWVQGRVAEQAAVNPRWCPGALELLAALRRNGIRCALVTMSWELMATTIAAQAPAGSFDVIISGDMVANGKPDPQCYLDAMTKLGVTADECVAIEDSPTGSAAAGAAGVRTLSVVNHVPVAPAAGRCLVTTLQGVTPEFLQHMPFAATS